MTYTHTATYQSLVFAGTVRLDEPVPKQGSSGGFAIESGLSSVKTSGETEGWQEAGCGQETRQNDRRLAPGQERAR